MKHWKQVAGTALLSSALGLAGQASAGGGYGAYEVTVTNITQGEIFTPIMVASHRRGVHIFELGSPASPELAMLAEGGDTGPLSSALVTDHGAHDVVTAGDVLPPGASVTLTVDVTRKNRFISVASMLVPTNDAFMAINGVEGPRPFKTTTVFSPAYDAGSENNDELCVSIPGPPFICAGEGYNPTAGEGYVHIHPGIQGVGDLVAADLAWHNPVAKISIKYVH